MSPLALVELVRGEIDGFLAECCHAWDHAPWILLVEEAGGRFTDRTGRHGGDAGGGLYSNSGLHTELLAAIGYPTRPRPPAAVRSRSAAQRARGVARAPSFDARDRCANGVKGR